MSSRHTKKRADARPLVLVAVAVGSMMLGGCYEHVVRATGAGASSVNTWEPNLKEDDSFLPSPSSEKRVKRTKFQKPPPNWY